MTPLTFGRIDSDPDAPSLPDPDRTPETPGTSAIQRVRLPVALVVATHPGRKLKPRVEILLDASKNPVTPRIVDLAGTLEDGAVMPGIANPLPDGAFGISLGSRIHQMMAGSQKNDS